MQGLKGPSIPQGSRRGRLAGEVLKEGQLIGRIYRAAEKRAIDHGLRDPDAQALEGFRRSSCQVAERNGFETDLK